MSDAIRLYVGMDAREWVGLNVFCSSVWRRASAPVQITPIGALMRSDGSNAFTSSRFLIPMLCNYSGWAIYADGSDMLCLADIAELWGMRDQRAVKVVKHDYRTRHPRKYLGEPNEDYPRKNWSSLMLMFCGHYGWRHAPVNDTQAMHRLSWFKDEDIGDLPKQWNYLVGEGNQAGPPKIVHYTIGLPLWEPYDRWDYAQQWRAERASMLEFADENAEGAAV